MSSNATNTTIINAPSQSSISWPAVAFLIFVAVVLIITIVLILYFEKLCGFARYRCLKKLLRRITGNKKSKSAQTNTHVSPITTLNLIEQEHKYVSDTPEYFWIAGEREPIASFQASSFYKRDNPGESIITDVTRTDLPDDDYTTLVPPVKQVNGNNRKLPQIPTIVEHKDNDASPAKRVKKSSAKSNDQQKTTITRITKQQTSSDCESIGHAQSAPSSPALLHNIKKRASQHKNIMDQMNIDAKSLSSDHGSMSANALNSSISSGVLEVRLKFDAKNSKMWVFVVKATIEMDQRVSKQTLVQIHLTVLPQKRIRYRTRAKPADNAMFAEEFFCKVSPETIQSQGIRFRLYANKRFKREKLLAEGLVMFGLVNLDEDMCKKIKLEPTSGSDDSDLGSNQSRRSSNPPLRSDSMTPTPSTSDSLLPELEIGLAYDKNQSMLTLEVGKGINFAMSSQGRTPDTCAQITLLNSNGQEIASNETAVRRNQHHPIFAERYPFSVSENLLNQITLMVTIMNKRASGKEDRALGWVSFGHGVRGNAQVAHWDSMLNSQGETITRWHTLLES